MDLQENGARFRKPGEETGLQVRFAQSGARGGARSRSTGWLVMLGGLLSGLLAFGLGELLHKRIPTERVPRDLMGTKIMVPSPETVKVSATMNAALAFGALGLCLAGSLGIIGGLVRRSASSPVKGGLVGAVLGLALGAGASVGLIPLAMEAQLDYPDYDLILSLATHAAIWGLTGASAGVAFAIGLGERRLIGGALMAGLVGAVVGAVVFELIGGAFFGLAETGKPISATWPTRFLARLLVTLGTAGAVAAILPKKTEVAERTEQIILEPPASPVL
jgi:hypothetical protein